MAEYDSLRLERDDGVVHVTLDSAARFNSLTPAMAEELVAVATDLASADDVRCITLTGNDEAFCAGADLAQFEGDDTDGHIDNLARFVSERTVVAAVEDDPDDVNHAALQENLKRLQATTTLDGRPLRVQTLPMPAPLVQNSRRLPASYANFYVGNRVVLTPAYGDANDEHACEVLQRCFPERRVVPIDCREVVWGLGAWHCLTQQVPAA